MLKKILDFAQTIQHSANFTSIYHQKAPADDSSVSDLVNAFRALGQEMPRSLLEFYRQCDGFRLRWTYKELTHPDFITAGDTDIVELEIILAAITHDPTEPILFDYVSDFSQVMLKLEKDQTVLLYHDGYGQIDYPMSINLDEYFVLLDETRGLYPWRELFIKRKEFQIEQELRDKFYSDLSLLFKDVDSEIFHQK